MKKEIIYDALIVIIGIFAEVIINKYLNQEYVGVLIALIAYLIYQTFRFSEVRDTLNRLRQEIEILKVHHELLTAPRGFLNYLFDFFQAIGKPEGYPLHTFQYTEILAKFLTSARQSFTATWTIDINLKHMSDSFVEQQKRDIKSKTRFLLFSKEALHRQLETEKRKIIEDFISWHNHNGVALNWLDRSQLFKELLQEGLTSPQATEVLQHCEDFLIIDEDIILFYDTRDEILEGGIPEDNRFYSVSLITLDILQKTQHSLYPNILKMVKKISTAKNYVRLCNYEDFQKICV